MNRQHPRPRLVISHGPKKRLERDPQTYLEPCSPNLQPCSPPSFCPVDGTEPSQFLQIGKYIINQVSPSVETCTAVDRNTGDEYTCKILPLSTYRRTLAPYLATDGHPNVVSIWEIILGQNCAYIFFQRGCGDLHSYIRKKKKLKQAEARALARQVVDAVCHCHEKGVVLRDLKLRKFVFRNADRTELFLDGLDGAVVLDDDACDMMTGKYGCPAYVSPEILSNSSGYSGKCADVWSLGVIIYTILVGRYPFHDREPAVMFGEIQRGLFKMPDTVPVRAKCLVRNLLRHVPSERLSAAEALEHPWFSRPVLVEPPGQSSLVVKQVDQIVPDSFVFLDSVLPI